MTLGQNRNFNGRVSLQGASNTIESSGTFNNGLVLTGTEFNVVLNRAGAQINQIFSLSGDGENRLENSGIVNNGLTIDGDGSSVVFNFANATINGDLQSVGTSNDFVDNYGLFNNRILQGDGIDVAINRPGGRINGQVSQGHAENQQASREKTAGQGGGKGGGTSGTSVTSRASASTWATTTTSPSSGS